MTNPTGVRLHGAVHHGPWSSSVGGSGHAGFDVTTGSTALGELDAYFGCDAREEPLGFRGLSRGGPPVSRSVAQCAQDEATPEPSALELWTDRDFVDVAGAAVATYLPE